MAFVTIKMGRRQGGPSRTGGRSGAYLNRYVTDEQRSRRPIFIATLRAAAGWLFFRVARSLRINLDMLVAPPETLRVTMWAELREALRAGRALKNSQLTCGESHVISRTGHWL
jgi:hypothetical protein